MKPERIQEEQHIPGEASATVRDFLDEYPAWQASAGGDRLTRDYLFTSSRVASAFSQYAAEIASELERPCTIQLRGAELRLILGAGRTLAEGDLELAAAINRAG